MFWERVYRGVFVLSVIGLVGSYAFGLADAQPAHRVEISIGYLLIAAQYGILLAGMLVIIAFLSRGRRDRMQTVFLALAGCTLFLALLPEGLIFLDGVRGSAIFHPFCMSPERRAYYLHAISGVTKGATLFGLLDVFDIDFASCRTQPASLGRFTGYGISLFFSSMVVTLLVIAYRKIRRERES
jgi:hypothetical protein